MEMTEKKAELAAGEELMVKELEARVYFESLPLLDTTLSHNGPHVTAVLGVRG